jgi:predicted TIM-barrel fold metal-dependent hydrolase
MRLVDTHQHLWDLRQFPYSWCSDIPELNRSFLLEDYLTAARDTGIVKTVFVECDVDEPHALEEARHVQKQRDPLIAGIVASARPERADFSRQLDLLLELPKLRGIRRVLHVVPDEVSQSAMFSKQVRSLAAHKLTFDLCVLARQLPLAIALAEKCPDVQFILDHCGIPDVKGRTFEPWASHIRQIATLQNVACKISGLVVQAGKDWTLEDLRPWFEHSIECFGWDRVLWGGDWPVCTLTATLAGWVDATRILLAGVTNSDRDALFYRNAERIYRV